MAKQSYRSKMIHQGYEKRAEFLREFSTLRDRDKALEAIGRSTGWLYKNLSRWADFKSGYDAMQRRQRTTADGENTTTAHSVEWNGKFDDFRSVFLGRYSPWFHVELSERIDKIEGGDIMLVVWPPEHGKTSLFEDRCTMDVAVDPNNRITVGKATIKFASLFVDVVRARLEADVLEYWKLRERFGPFAPMQRKNAFGQSQVWSSEGFNVFKRRLGQERDFNMQALGMGSDIAGTRCDRLYIDDPQSRKTLNLTEKILETMRDDWFSRPGVTGSTVVLMNVVGDGDIAEKLIDDEVCDHITVLKAYDERYLEMGPRPNQDGDLELSPWLWPERYSERDYDRLRRNAGPEGWARKYQQDWRPAVGRTFTQEHIDKCKNKLRSIHHPCPKHPAGHDAEVAVSIDPSFKRTAVGAAAFEPTRFVVLDTEAETAVRSLAQMIDMLVAQVERWHQPGRSLVRWVIVETKGMQAGVATDDRLLELQVDVGFEIQWQETGWDKHDEDFGVAQMARSMARGEFDFPSADDESDARFAALYREMKDWRPGAKLANRGSRLKQDELMALWFAYTRWHKMRRRSIRRGSNAASFGFSPLPTMPGSLVIPRSRPVSDWSFGRGVSLVRPGGRR